MTDIPNPLIDRFGREISYLRLSVTDRCDLRCSYCMAEHMTFLPKKDLLTLEELEQVAYSFVERGVKKIRITGGEPLVRRDILSLFERLGKLVGHQLEELTLTTNATQLATHAADLRRFGVKRVNVSLDTLDPIVFERITRRGDLPKVLKGIDAALEAGLDVKINTVALKHENAVAIPEMVSWAHSKGMDITLIEVMPLGETGEDRIDQFIPLSVIRQSLEDCFSLEDVVMPIRNAGPARYASVRETERKIGFISPLTNNFCAGCNRVRVTCTGRIYMCLGQDDHIDLRTTLRTAEDPKAALEAALDTALLRKPEKHDFSIERRGQAPALDRHMSVTGG